MSDTFFNPQWTQRLVVGWLATALTIGVGTFLASGCGRPTGDSGAVTPSPTPASSTSGSTPTRSPAQTPAQAQTPAPSTERPSTPAAVAAPGSGGMLQPEDVGPQWRAETFRGDWPTEFLCRPRDTVGPGAISTFLDYDAVVFTDQPPPAPGVDNDGRANWIDVARGLWPDGRARAAFAYFRERMRACQGGTMSPTRKVTIVDSPLVGDESFLVELTDTETGQQWFSIFLRRGEVTSEIFVSDDRQLALNLGRRAAERACEITRC